MFLVPFLEYLRDRRFPFATEEKRVYFSQYKEIFLRAVDHNLQLFMPNQLHGSITL